MLRRDEEVRREFQRVSQAELDRLNNDPDVQQLLACHELDRMTPINIAAARQLMAEQVQRVSRDDVHQAASNSDELVVFENHGLLLVGMVNEVVEAFIVFDDDDDFDFDLDEDGDDEDFPVFTFEPAQYMPMPTMAMSADGLRLFVSEQDGRWLMVPSDGLAISYQANVRDGKLVLSAGIAELDQQMDDDPDMDQLSAARRLSFSVLLAEELGIEDVVTDIPAN